MISAQKYIDSNFPKQERLNIIDLEISQKNLKGHLDLREFVNLEKLDCSENELTSIDLSNNKKIKWIDCSDNLLNDIDFSYQSPRKLEGIIISNNNLSSRDLSCFSRFINLQSLYLGTYDEEKLEKNNDEFKKGLKIRNYQWRKPGKILVGCLAVILVCASVMFLWWIKKNIFARNRKK